MYAALSQLDLPRRTAEGGEGAGARERMERIRVLLEGATAWYLRQRAGGGRLRGGG